MPKRSGGSIRITGIGTKKERWHLTGASAQSFFDGFTKKPEPENILENEPAIDEETLHDEKNKVAPDA